jgi:regulator of sigma E protease
MPDFVFSLLAFVVAISVLVAVHEYGHFWVARRLGFKVLRFSIGFGKPLWKWRGRVDKVENAISSLPNDSDRVEYWLSSIPLGGYVKMLDEREGPVAEHERHRAFNRRPIPQRIAVLLAGPGFNFLFAILVYWLMFISGVPGIRPIVEGVVPGSLAEAAGLRPGDVIETIGNEPTATLEDAVLTIFDELLADGRIDLMVHGLDESPRSVELDVRGRVSALTEPDALFPGLGFSLGAGALVPADIDRIDAGSPAEQAGFAPGDRVIAADGQAIEGWQQWVAFVRARPGETVATRVLRDGREVELMLVIGAVEENGVEVGRIGTWPIGRVPDEIVERIRTEQRYGPIAAVSRSVARTWEMSTLTVRLLGHMVMGEVSLRNASGPIMIAAYAGDSAALGLTAFLSFLGIVSISLGIMNLLPVPILDGGQIVFQIAEWLKGGPLSERAHAFGQQLGIVFLLLLMGVVFYNDLSRIFAT